MSGTKVPYHLRVNKYIDRQLFVEALDLVGKAFPLERYGYVSMAGIYLEDCRVIHQETQISRMYSFDVSDDVLKRQKINVPYGFVQYEKENSRDVIKNIDAVRQRLGNEDLNLVIWLDYANANQRQAQLQELSILVPKLMSGDVVRVTMNAHRRTLGEQEEFRHLSESEKRPTIHEWRHGKLKKQLGRYLPADRDDSKFLETPEEFYCTIIRCIKHAVVSVVHGRSGLLAVPVLTTAYDDQHGMVTATFVIINADQESTFRQGVNWKAWQFDPGPEWDRFVNVQVPTLSLRERHALHACLQSDGTFIQNPDAFLSSTEMDQYKQHYRRYPFFAPFTV